VHLPSIGLTTDRIGFERFLNLACPCLEADVWRSYAICHQRNSRTAATIVNAWWGSAGQCAASHERSGPAGRSIKQAACARATYHASPGSNRPSGWNAQRRGVESNRLANGTPGICVPGVFLHVLASPAAAVRCVAEPHSASTGRFDVAADMWCSAGDSFCTRKQCVLSSLRVQSRVVQVQGNADRRVSSLAGTAGIFAQEYREPMFAGRAHPAPARECPAPCPSRWRRSDLSPPLQWRAPRQRRWTWLGYRLGRAAPAWGAVHRRARDVQLHITCSGTELVPGPPVCDCGLRTIRPINWRQIMKRLLIAIVLITGTFVGASVITTTDGICQNCTSCCNNKSCMWRDKCGCK